MIDICSVPAYPPVLFLLFAPCELSLSGEILSLHACRNDCLEVFDGRILSEYSEDPPRLVEKRLRMMGTIGTMNQATVAICV